MAKEFELDDGTIVSQQEYLYGADAEIPEIPQDVIMRRVEALMEHQEKLMAHSWHTRDGKRCNKVFNAIKFWQNLNGS